MDDERDDEWGEDEDEGHDMSLTGGHTESPPSSSFGGTHDEGEGDDGSLAFMSDGEEVVDDEGVVVVIGDATTEGLETILAAFSAALERETTDVSGLDLDALVALDERITQLCERAATFRDTLAAMRAGVQCAITHRRCAAAVEAAQPDFVCPISHSLMRDPVVNPGP